MSGGSKERMDGVLADNLAMGQTPTQAAAAAGVSRATAYRRLEDPEFREQVVQRRAQLVDELTSRMTEASHGAFARIQLLMLDSASEQIQLRAASKILEQTVRLRDVVEFESRIRKVEELCQPKNED